jgi:hypothetical protein
VDDRFDPADAENEQCRKQARVQAKNDLAERDRWPRLLLDTAYDPLMVFRPDGKAVVSVFPFEKTRKDFLDQGVLACVVKALTIGAAYV